MRLQVHPEATAELVAQQDFYDARLPGLGGELEEEIDAALGMIVAMPDAWEHWPGLPEVRVFVLPSRKLSPRVACRNKWACIEALQRCKQFVEDYRDTWCRWCAGARDVLFPAGTYLMARRFDVAVAEP